MDADVTGRWIASLKDRTDLMRDSAENEAVHIVLNEDVLHRKLLDDVQAATGKRRKGKGIRKGQANTNYSVPPRVGCRFGLAEGAEFVYFHACCMYMQQA
jgi:hypothetical protein